MHNFDVELTEQQLKRLEAYTPDDLDVMRFYNLITTAQNGYMIAKSCLKGQSAELLSSRIKDEG